MECEKNMDYNPDIIKQKMEIIRKNPHPKNRLFFDNLKKWDDETLLSGLHIMELAAEMAQVGYETGHVGFKTGKDLEWCQLNILFYQEEIKRRKNE